MFHPDITALVDIKLLTYIPEFTVVSFFNFYVDLIKNAVFNIGDVLV